MVITASDLREAGICVPLLVGGAALSEKFTRLKIAPQYKTAVCYAKDAMTGLRLMNELSDPGRRGAVLEENTFSEVAAVEEAAPKPGILEAAGEERSPEKFTPIFQFPQWRISTAKPAQCRTLNEIVWTT